MRYPTISNSRRNVTPRNEHQACAIDLLLTREVPVKLLLGRGGSGKDYLMTNAAMCLLERGKFKKIVYIRPNVTVGDIPDLGYLKGDMQAKLEWTMGPLIDKFGTKDDLNRLVKSGQIETIPIAFMRGCSFENAIVYVSEGQNLTSAHMKLLVTRVGENSELWINGDCAQTDKRIYKDDNGIRRMQEVLSGCPEFGQIYLPFIERSGVAKLGELFD